MNTTTRIPIDFKRMEASGLIAFHQPATRAVAKHHDPQEEVIRLRREAAGLRARIRELERRLVIHLESVPEDVDLAESIQSVFNAIETVTTLTKSDLLHQCRKQHFADARHLFCWCLRALGVSWHKIGQAVNRDHNCALNSVRVIDGRLRKLDKVTILRVNAVRKLLGLTTDH